MWRIFMATISDGTFRNTICVFDALDECRDRDKKLLIEKLRGFHVRRLATQRNWLKFLVTSRPYDDIQDLFRPVIDLFPQIHLRGEEENDQIRREINLVVKVKRRLEKELTEMKHHTYLWLYLAIDDIKRTLKDSFRPRLEKIPPLPKSVPEAYERILCRVTADQKPKVEMILRIIVGARRPLTIQEMAMALGVATFPNAETAAEAGLCPDGLDKKIRQLCGLFIFIRDSKVYLIHQTAREFLISQHVRSASFHWYLEPHTTEVQMTNICVRYLLMNDLVSNREKLVRSLLEYSAENWADHSRNVLSLEKELVQQVWKLYNVAIDQFHLWFPIFWKEAMRYSKDPGMNAMHLAAFNGHQEILSLITVNEQGAINRVDRSGTNALQWACLRGHFDIVQRLLEKGANVNAKGGKYGNALYAAAEGGHIHIVQTLLEKGANVNAQDKINGSALQAAAYEGHLEIVERLLEKGADVSAKGGRYGNALQAAAYRGHLEIIERLLEKGADVNAEGGEYGNALQAAAYGGHLEIFQRLLEKEADANAEGGFYGTAIQAAANGGHLEIFERLLEKGADANAKGGRYGNALQAAAYGGYLEIVDRLLEKGADVNAKGGEYGNALQAAAYGGHLEIVDRLLEKRADVNAKGARYGNALFAATCGRHLDIVKRLRERKPNFNPQREEFGNSR
ncbi:ankyrin repeat-containing protein, putative [Talaromyces stipitatus ATCC 10500]|uniref:Ankyrin repeat-containing protein, putative n=1 Tax=Talaromyces stipitatus (strain ATCC 10500 / CBS 375.48 / QM 6759 / NRRL 1006) TaxID=441959 RepID=B8LYM6_TALSN|nr:ankyrin repeat-containing protein, putative [Talaromyces stipitatus ATCC 10500]EED23384.1 ankyrin repeat-containing protein, putative [Talaromyces stipitatus ATCC 10500]